MEYELGYLVVFLTLTHWVITRNLGHGIKKILGGALRFQDPVSNICKAHLIILEYLFFFIHKYFTKDFLACQPFFKNHKNTRRNNFFHYLICNWCISIFFLRTSHILPHIQIPCPVVRRSRESIFVQIISHDWFP